MSRMPQDLSIVGWPVHTDRLVIRPARPNDVEATWQIRRMISVSCWLTSAAEDRVQYSDKFLDPERISKMLVLERGGAVIGDLMLAIRDGCAQTEVAIQAKGVEAELGWVVHPAHSGQGLATEAVRAVLRVCFEDLGLRRVTAQCFAENVPSWRLMERLGMRREQYSVRDFLHRSGKWMDRMTYAILASEWRARSLAH